MIKTMKQAKAFVLKHKVCTIFKQDKEGTACLWDNLDYPDTTEDGKGWNKRVQVIWAWKNELPETFPDDIFYGKIPGGFAVLMCMKYLKEIHYPSHYKPVKECSELAREIFDLVRLEPYETGPLRKECVELFGCTKSRFDTALKQLQVTLNVARSNEIGVGKDLWMKFSELYPEIGL